MSDQGFTVWTSPSVCTEGQRPSTDDDRSELGSGSHERVLCSCPDTAPTMHIIQIKSYFVACTLMTGTDTSSPILWHCWQHYRRLAAEEPAPIGLTFRLRSSMLSRFFTTCSTRADGAKHAEWASQHSRGHSQHRWQQTIRYHCNRDAAKAIESCA
jgi:hypothetical protein